VAFIPEVTPMRSTPTHANGCPPAPPPPSCPTTEPLAFLARFLATAARYGKSLDLRVEAEGWVATLRIEPAAGTETPPRVAAAPPRAAVRAVQQLHLVGVDTGHGRLGHHLLDWLAFWRSSSTSAQSCCHGRRSSADRRSSDQGWRTLRRSGSFCQCRR